MTHFLAQCTPYVIIIILAIYGSNLHVHGGEEAGEQGSMEILSNVTEDNSTKNVSEPETTVLTDQQPILWAVKPINNNTINSSCEVIITSTKRNELNSEMVDIVDDPCTDEPLRKFLHCSPATKRCECYRDWGDASPNYRATPAEWEATPQWFEYDHGRNECMVITGMKCGAVNAPSPYRCRHEGRCVETKKEDNFLLFCSLGDWITPGTLLIGLPIFAAFFSRFLFVYLYSSGSAL